MWDTVAGAAVRWPVRDLTWTPGRTLPAAQQPRWPDPAALAARPSRSCTALPPLVFAGECDDAAATGWPRSRAGEAFLLQGGDCAETFDGRDADAIRGKLKTAAADGGRAHLRRVACRS